MQEGVGDKNKSNNQHYNEGGKLMEKPKIIQGKKDPDAIIL